MDITLTGNIIYWNPTFGYGFIECTKLKENIFFHKSNCNYKSIELFDKVSFQISISNSKKHKGKKVAIQISLIESGNFKNYDLRIGTIQNWNGRFGFIDYPTDGKKIFLFHTRLLYDKNIKNDDLIVFNPIVSSKDKTQLFAFFAYPIHVELDIGFLKSQYEKYQIPALKDYILSISHNSEFSLSVKFELELLEIGEISNNYDYLKLKELLKKYSEKFSFTPSYYLLSKHISAIYLIQLWESDIITSYDINIIKEYFIKTNADTKREIFSKLTETDKEVVIEYYFNHLKNLKKFERVNNDLKTFLDIVYRNEKTRTFKLYDNVKQYLLTTLKPDELINLWLHDYIDELSENFVVMNFNLGDKNAIKLLLQKKDKNSKADYTELMSKIYEQYFIDIANENLDFELEYPNLVRYLKIFEENFKQRYTEIINILQKTLKAYQKFVLWILGINIHFDAYSFVQSSIEEINHYFRLKFLLRYLNDNQNIDLKSSNSIQVDINGLRDFAINYQWNEVIYPTKIIGREEVHSFLNDIIEYNTKYLKNLDVIILADSIYQSIEKYSEIHIRLWLYIFYPDKKYYDYVGFSNCFKKLTNEEQKEFRLKANERDFSEIVEQEISEVKPCKNYEKNNETTKTYNAFVENVYFSNGAIRLRLEDGNYTEPFPQEYSSTGLNRIPANHYLNKILLKIVVEENSKENVIIKKVEGFDILFTQIHTGEIEKALGTVVEGNVSTRQNNSYVEDWQLRKQVIDYLNASQYKKFEITIVNEPKNLFRRLDQKSGIDLFEKTALFTIKIENKNEYAIIWENLDFSDDRATYIFKCHEVNHNKQIQKIADAISSLAQFRSTLSSTKDDRELHIFKNNFGYITSIRKQRGKNKPFSNWLKKLENALTQKVPELPSIEELEELMNWTPNIPHTARINKSSKVNYKPTAIIKENELATTEIFTLEQQNNKGEKLKETNSSQKENKILLLNTLKTFNHFFYENFKIETQ